jgi:hypothetical protein
MKGRPDKGRRNGNRSTPVGNKVRALDDWEMSFREKSTRRYRRRRRQALIRSAAIVALIGAAIAVLVALIAERANP